MNEYGDTQDLLNGCNRLDCHRDIIPAGNGTRFIIPLYELPARLYCLSEWRLCVIFDKAFECGAIEAQMSNTGSVWMAANDVRVFTEKPRKKMVNVCVHATFMTPLFVNYSDQQVGFVLLSLWYPSPFIRLSHKNVFWYNSSFPFQNLSPLKACH